MASYISSFQNLRVDFGLQIREVLRLLLQLLLLLLQLLGVSVIVEVGGSAALASARGRYTRGQGGGLWGRETHLERGVN